MWRGKDGPVSEYLTCFQSVSRFQSVLDVDDDVVKLYDLTALCGEGKTDRCQNPFTVPVGILLYRVARNMRQTAGTKNVSTIRALLENSLLLLDEEKHPQVRISN